MNIATAPSNPVRELILRRAKDDSQPGKRADDYTLGLCIEGGSMRGVVSAGMVTALEQLGLLRVFDHVFGSSAGAMNGAFFVAGQAAYGTTIYYENINNNKFIDFRRAFGDKPIVDIDFLVWEVMVHEKPLNAQKVLDSPVPLHVVAANVDSGKPEVLNSWDSGRRLLESLRAGATMPIVGGPPYGCEGGRYWDPMFFRDSIPVGPAENFGCTHILVLLTRPQGIRRRSISPLERYLVLPQIRRVSRTLAVEYARREVAYSELLDEIDRFVTSTGKAHTMPIRPAPPAVGKLERRRRNLLEGAVGGMNAVFEAFNGGGQHVTEVLKGFSDDGRELRRIDLWKSS